jgi:hypothetical protein
VSGGGTHRPQGGTPGGFQPRKWTLALLFLQSVARIRCRGPGLSAPRQMEAGPGLPRRGDKKCQYGVVVRCAESAVFSRRVRRLLMMRGLLTRPHDARARARTTSRNWFIEPAAPSRSWREARLFGSRGRTQAKSHAAAGTVLWPTYSAPAAGARGSVDFGGLSRDTDTGSGCPSAMYSLVDSADRWAGFLSSYPHGLGRSRPTLDPMSLTS